MQYLFLVGEVAATSTQLGRNWKARL